MTMVSSQIKMEDEDRLDFSFWLKKSITKRMAEVTRLRKKYYAWLHGSYPNKMEK